MIDIEFIIYVIAITTSFLVTTIGNINANER